MKKTMIHSLMMLSLAVTTSIMASDNSAITSAPSGLTTQAQASSNPAGMMAQGSSNAPANLDIYTGLSGIAEKAIPAVVNVSTTQIIQQKDNPDMPKFAPGSPFDELFKPFFDQQDKPRRVQSLGSGFIIQSDQNEAYVVTNYHVIADAKKVTIILHDKTELEATIHSFDDRTDLALLKVKTDKLPSDKRILTTLDWGNSDTTKVGHFVVAIGNPFGLGSTVTSGIISSKGRDIAVKSKSAASQYVDDFIQHDASLNMGNSGGVLLDMNGKVIGVNTAIFSPTGGSVGIGFAIPSALAKNTIDQLMKFGHPRRGYLGVKIYPVTKEMAESLGIVNPSTGNGEASGGIVMEITQDSPAAKAGIKEKDIITEFDGKKLNDHNRLNRVVGETEVGKNVTVKVLRDGKEVVINNLVLGEYPITAPKPQDIMSKDDKPADEKLIEPLGLAVVPYTSKASEENKEKIIKGVAISKVIDGTNADEIGLMRGDVIMQINQKEINTPQELEKIVNESMKAGRKSVLLSVIRAGSPLQFVVVELSSAPVKEEVKK